MDDTTRTLPAPAAGDAPGRERRRAVILVATSAAVVTAAVLYAVVTTVGGGDALEYFKHVDEVADTPAKWAGRKLRLHGNVVRGTIQKKKGSMTYRFALYHGDRWVEVTYAGMVPDTFKDCAEVVARGRLSRDGRRFEADQITAKCPSKYDMKQRSAGCGEALRPKVLASRGR